MYTAVRAFKTKLCLWENQMLQGHFGHFPCCQTIKMQMSTAVFPCAQFVEKLSVLAAEFSWRFADFDVQKCRFELLSNPFADDVENAPTNLQMDLIELQCNNTMKSKYDTQAAQMLSMFGSTYVRNFSPR